MPRTEFTFLGSWFENLSITSHPLQPDSFCTCHLSFATHHWQNRVMKTFTSLITILFATLIAIPSFAQSPAESPATAARPAAAPAGQQNPQEMTKQMMEMSKLNDNHKLLSSMDV